MFLDAITLTKTLPCLAEPGKIIVIGKPSRSLDEVLPYMATLPGVISWNPETLALTLRRQPGFLTLQREETVITQVKDVQEGLELLVALRDSINAVWKHRDELVAVTKPRRTPRVLDVWSLLPQTNCKQCGEPTCMAFAVALLQANRVLDECPVMQSDAHFGDRRVTIMSLLSIS
jgi:ArsR family metal-binding transcriptional regulator